MRTQTGFTLIEVMISLAVLAISLGLAIPQFHNLMQGARISNAQNGLYSLFQLARGEALMRRQHVVVCASQDGQLCAGSWQQGALVFVDHNRNRQHERNEKIISQFTNAEMRQLSITGNRLLSAFLPTGRASGSNQSLTICAPGRKTGGAVVISNAGRVRTGKASCAA
jgi:type IV fimbrial biogenesis protein FimT